MTSPPADGPERDSSARAADDARARWAAQVGSALHALDDIGASALRLIYQQHLTQAQAARRLGVAESTVKIHVARALRQLAANLPGSSAGMA